MALASSTGLQQRTLPQAGGRLQQQCHGSALQLNLHSSASCSVVLHGAGPAACSLPAAARAAVLAHAGSYSAALPLPDGAASFGQQHGSSQMYGQQQQQQQQLTRSIRSCSSYEQLLELLQQHSWFLSAADVTNVLHRASALAKTAARQHNAAAGSSRAGTRQQRSADAAAAQQLVSACLAALLQVQQQVGPHELSNCLLSLAVLCGSCGPAAGVLGSSQAASRTTSSSSSSSSTYEQAQQWHAGGSSSSSGSSNGAVLQQLITPASSRALEQLLVAAAPQHQLQQLLELTHTAVLPAAQQHQLVNMLYGLAVLRVRPAPHVLQQLLAHTQQHIEQLVAESAAHTSSSSSSSSDSWHARGDRRATKVLSQLLWAAATLQLQLPRSWLRCFWAASALLLPQFSAQDVSNVAWAAGALRLSPSDAWLLRLQQQASAVACSMSGQGLANTLWGCAVVAPQGVRPAVLLQLLQCCIALGPAGLDGQNLANMCWAAARCLAAASSSSSSSSWDERSIAHAQQQLQQLLSACQPLLPRLAPRDWSNILWACGLLRWQPGPEVLGQLWRKTPAGFSTSLNPHSSSRPTAWSPQGLANVLWGCARLGLRPPGVWLQGFEAAAVLLLPQFGPQELANMLWACGELRYAPSEAWMQQYWRQAAGLVAQLREATTAAANAPLTTAPAVGSSNSSGSAGALEQQDAAAEEAQQQLQAGIMHVAMVLQAAGRLGSQPPGQWLEAAAAALANAAGVQQQQQWQQQRQSVTAALYGLSRLQLHQTISSSSSKPLAPASAVQQLLQCMGLAVPSMHDTAGSTATVQAAVHLSGMDVLLVLAALPGLQLPRPAAAAVAVQLLAAAQLAAARGGFGSGQLVQLAVAAAAVARDINITGSIVESSSPPGQQNSNKDRAALAVSSSSSRMSTYRRDCSGSDARALWAAVAAAVEAEQRSSTGSSSSSSARSTFVCALASQLQQHCASLSAADLAASLTALAQLHASSASSSSRSGVVFRQQARLAAAAAACPGTAGFVAAAGQAVAQHTAGMHAGSRAAAAAGLARLGYCPSPDWLDSLLLHSSCQWHDCSNGAMASLAAALPLFFANSRLAQQQQQQQQQQVGELSSRVDAEQAVASAMLAAALAPDARSAPYTAAARLLRQQQRQRQQQHVREWCQSWLDESAGRLAGFTPQQLSAAAAALQKLAAYCCCQPGYPRGMQQVQQLRWQQQRGVRQLLTADWRRAYCRAVLLLLPRLDSAELVRLVAAAVALRMRPGRRWCAGVACEAAVRASAGPAALAADASSSSSSSSSSWQLQVHHVGLLAWYLTQLGFEPYPSRQQQLLQFVQAACHPGNGRAAASGSSSSSSSSSSRNRQRRVKARQLQLAVQLLRRAGWPVDQQWQWQRHVRRSVPGRRLRLRLKHRQGAWQALWSGAEAVPADAEHAMLA
uniref:RAP domain-containing protein n=1 Tax=Tetradesmus obliquus TaxID=3088 RepID=A0A383V718_TETOB|eukprot:jgi/Sobl393_1/17059/SZX60529.1